MSTETRDANSAVRRPSKRWLVIAASLLTLLVFCEVLTRMAFIPLLKRDEMRFPTYPARAARLTEQTGLRLAFIGNSATQFGLDPAQFTDDLASHGHGPVHVDLFLADGSEIHTWYYMAQNLFWEAPRKPDWLIVTFFTSQLADEQRYLDVSRLAFTVTASADWPEVFQTQLPTVSSRLDFALSASWATFALRRKIQSKLLARLVPHYDDYLDECYRQQARGRAATAPPPARFDVLQRFLDRSQAAAIKVCFVAFPTPTHYHVEPEIAQRIAAAQMAFLDLRDMPGLRQLYFEGVHLNPEGAAIYTRRFARDFERLLRQR
jgi:hypothetical protein